MAEWAAKRFWTEVNVVEEGAGFGLRLDSRALKTPAKTALVVPTRPMAEAIAAEWLAQEDKIDPLSMPATRAANAAIDKVAPQQAEVVEMLAAYGETDLLCHRAATPDELAERQSRHWDPLLDWAAERFEARLTPVVGVMPVGQDAEALARLRAPVAAMSHFELAGFHDLVSLSGSLVLGLAAVEQHLPAAEIWDLSRLDEHWQAEQWGQDEEAEEMAAVKRAAFFDAERFYRLSLS